MTNKPTQKMVEDDRLVKLADKAIAADRDHMVAEGRSLDWLIAQLANWPTRVDEAKTTNQRFLLVSAAATLRSLVKEAKPVDGAAVERLQVELNDALFQLITVTQERDEALAVLASPPPVKDDGLKEPLRPFEDTVFPMLRREFAPVNPVPSSERGK